jgi:inorganic triphosphatase YgiF
MGTGADSMVETERKYEVADDFTIPDLAGLAPVVSVAEPAAYLLDAVYFDTADLRLLAARVTLRRRSGGTDAGWHLKLPIGDDSRRELHAPVADGGTAVPASLAAVAARWADGQPLRPVARLRTTRQVRLLLDRAGVTLAEVADDQVSGSVPADLLSRSGERAPDDATTDSLAESPWSEVTAWREVEAELRAGPRGLLDSVGDRLCSAGALPARSASKLAHVLARAGFTPAGSS